MTRNAIATALFAGCALHTTAHADVANLAFDGTGLGRTVRITSDGRTRNVFAGELRHEFGDATGDAAHIDGTYATFCFDYHETVSRSSIGYNLIDLEDGPWRLTGDANMGDGRADAIRAMSIVAWNHQQNGTYDRNFANAFQLAVWEVVEDFDANIGIASFDLTSGDFSATKKNGNDLWQETQNHLSDLAASIVTPDPSGLVGGVLAFANRGAQDQLLITAPTAATPAPATAALLLLPLAARRRRRA